VQLATVCHIRNQGNTEQLGIACNRVMAIAHTQTSPSTNKKRPVHGLTWWGAWRQKRINAGFWYFKMKGNKNSGSRDTLLLTVLHICYHAPHSLLTTDTNFTGRGQYPWQPHQHNINWEPLQATLLLFSVYLWVLPPDLRVALPILWLLSDEECLLSSRLWTEISPATHRCFT